MERLEPVAPNSLVQLVGRPAASVAEVFRARVRETPDNPFLIFSDQTWTYGQAWRRCQHLARRFSRSGVPEQGRVATVLGNCPETVWSWLATQLLGGTFVPINPDHRGPILRNLLHRSNAAVLVTERERADELTTDESTLMPSVLPVDDRCFSAEDSEVATSGGPPLATPHPADPAVMLFTSGTTGRSKAALVPHNAVCRGSARLADYTALNADDVVQAWLPLHHIGGIDALTMAMLTGAAVHLLPRFSRSHFWEDVQSSQSTVFFLFPSVTYLLLSAPRSNAEQNNSLRVGITTGIPYEIASNFEKRFQVKLLVDYGMTEAEPIAYQPLDREIPAGSCGIVNPDFDLNILDSDDRPVAAGLPGEIAIRPTVEHVMSSGYEGDPDATAFAWRGQWFHTGDLGYVDPDGHLFFVDRIKDSIRRRGENISSWEVESIILGHPSVENVAVVGVPSPLGEQDVKAVVSLKPRASCAPDHLWAYCRDTMARYMLPRYIQIVDSLPVTPTGKVRKETLRVVSGDEWDADANALRLDA